MHRADIHELINIISVSFLSKNVTQFLTTVVNRAFPNPLSLPGSSLLAIRLQPQITKKGPWFFKRSSESPV